MDLDTKTTKACKASLLPQKYQEYFLQLYESYRNALKNSGEDPSICEPLFLTLLEKIEENIRTPFTFAPYHKRIISPFNYQEFALNFIKPLIDTANSSVQGLDHLQEIADKIERGENVIFLANHQIEADPQAIGILLENLYPELAKEMIFVAGERVILDPLAVPFSMGHNLLCVYSKRHIDHPPELKMQKQLHNKKTLELMSELLSEGGHCIYVAPSGGRDRADDSGRVCLAPFNAESIELFYLMTQRASKPTSFYPMALSTYSIVPPPDSVQIELGETRTVNKDAIHLWVGPQISMDYFPGAEEVDKKQKRKLRAEYIFNQVKEAYAKFPL